MPYIDIRDYVTRSLVSSMLIYMTHPLINDVICIKNAENTGNACADVK